MVWQPGRARRDSTARARMWALTALLAAVLLGALLVPNIRASVAGDPPAAEDFTLAVLPDVQGYTATTTHESTFGDQVKWLVEKKEDLNIAWVTQLGDLVEAWPDRDQWGRADKYMKVLDDARIPNSVLPGNHDLDLVAGESSTYDNYFPPSRYSTASWNSATASYGGYLGQNLFGPDPVDRKNKDNFGLFTAGGLDFVLINLEFESPDYTLDWAQKVLDAYPDRRAIISTHGFVSTAGARSDVVLRSDPNANSAAEVWNKLIYDNCNIFLVLNGHWHAGDEGEARRADSNACGKPVHQILSNYQERINGGDGWLRYYHFSPSTNTIKARTYSPKLGRFEKDSDSAFSVAYDMSPTRDVNNKDILVRGGSTWAWWYQNTPWPEDWSTRGFVDGNWPRGNATLGFGADGNTTNIDAPAPTANRGTSALFRHSFQVTDADRLSSVNIATRADDGLAVSVNGVEVGRMNMPKGTVKYTTYASSARSTDDATAEAAVFSVPATLLRDGRNVVSASVHLNYKATPDLSFDLVMSAVREGGEPPPAPPRRPVVTATAIDSTTALIGWQGGEDPAVEYRISRDGGTPATVSEPTRTFTDSGLPPGSQHEYTVVAVGETGLLSPGGSGSVTLPPPPVGVPTPVTVVDAGSSWKWLYSSSDWPTGWTGPSFADATWAEGRAPLGFGSPSIITNIDVPPPRSDRPPSALFRRSFTLTAAHEYSRMVVSTHADDGVAVWVNGTEVGRNNVTGLLDDSTNASSAERTTSAIATPARFDVPASLLRDGENVVAVSVHLNHKETSDASMDLSLTGERTTGEQTELPPGPPTVTATATSPTEASVAWTPGSGPETVSYRILRDGSQVGTATAPTRTFSDTGVTASRSYSYAVVAIGATGLASAAGAAEATTPAPPITGNPEILVPRGSAWSWLYSNSAWPAGWTSVAFDDTSWAEDRAPFGFGFHEVRTNIDVPPPTSDRPRASVFRHTFTIDDASELSSISAEVQVDDGVVVYLNGVEIGRTNMTSGKISSSTYSHRAPRTSEAAAAPVTFTIPSSLVTDGRNVLSASVHVNFRATRDVSFDLAVTATRTPSVG